MTKILQGNMNRSRTAHELMTQIISELEVEVVIINEPYRDRDGPMWFKNAANTAAIWVPNSRTVRIEGNGAGEDYVWARVNGVTYMSVYLSPNCSADEYRRKLEALEDALTELPNEKIVAGDFNARATEWGMPQTNTRGRLLLEMAAKLNLVVLNTGASPTYRRPGWGNSIPDVTLATEATAAKVEDWKVTEEYRGSDHQYIAFDIRDQTRRKMPTDHILRWNVEKLDRAKFDETLRNGQDHPSRPSRDLGERESAEVLVNATICKIKRACDASMPRVTRRTGRTPAYWWTEEIAELRRLCLRARRRAQRARNRNEATGLSAEHKDAKKALRDAIKRSKDHSWKKLCTEIDTDPWGLGYQIVTKKLGARGPAGALDARAMNTIIHGLFPSHQPREETNDMAATDEVPAFTREELNRAASRLKTRKAPRPDGIPTEALKATAQTRPELLLEMYNRCLQAGVFSARWKKAKLVLISKGKGDPNSPSAYRPLACWTRQGSCSSRC